MKADEAIDLSAPCEHVTAEMPRHAHRPPPGGCKECLKIGSEWLHLRICLTCGNVACCDDSPMRHATAHFKKSHHPVITSGEVGETWTWCYVDEAMLSAD